MNFIQFVAPLIGGYWFLWTWNHTKFIVRKDSGYHLFFKSSIVGIILLIIAKQLSPDIFGNEVTTNLIPDGFDSSAILAMIMGIVSGYLLNFFFSKTKGLTRAAMSHGKFFLLMIQEAFDQSLMIEVTLSSGKVYIGFPLNEMAFDSEDLSLIPLFSGYRESITKELIVTKEYAKEIKSILDAEKNCTGQLLLPKFTVIVRTKDIVSARLFYPDIFKKLNANMSNS